MAVTARRSPDRPAPAASRGFSAPLASFAILALLLSALSPAAAQSSCTSAFTAYSGIAMNSWGNDVANYTNYASPSFTACLMDCCSIPDGKCGTAYYRSDTQRCWLRTSLHVPDPNAQPNSSPSVSFASRRQPQPIPQGELVPAAASDNATKVCRQNVTLGYDIPGWDLGTVNGTSYTGYVSLSWQTCQADCCALAPRNCTSWSYNIYTRQCYIKVGRALNLSPNPQFVFGRIPPPDVLRGVNIAYPRKVNVRAGLGRRQLGVVTTNTTSGPVSFNVTDMWNTAWWSDAPLNSSYKDVFQPDWTSCMQLCADVEDDKCGSFFYDQERRTCTLRSPVFFADQNTNNNQTGSNYRYPWGYRVLPTLEPGLQPSSPIPSDPSQTFACSVKVLDNTALNGWDINSTYADFWTATSLACNAACCQLGNALCTAWNWNKQTRKCWLKRRGDWMDSAADMRIDSSFMSGIMPYPAIITGQTAYTNPSVVYEVTNSLSPTWWGSEINSTFNNFLAVDWTQCQAACTKIGNICGTYFYNKIERKCYLKTSVAFASTNPDPSWVWGVKVGPGVVEGLQSITASNSSNKVQMNVTAGMVIDGWEFRSRYLSPTWLDCARDAAAWWPQATSFTYNCATRYCQLRQGRADNARTSADDLFGVVPTPPVIEGVSTSDNDGSTCTFNTIEQLSPTWWGNELRTAPNGMFAVDWTVCRAQCCKLGATCGTWFFDRYQRKCYFKSSASFPSNNTDRSWTWGSKVAPMIVTGQQTVTGGSNSCPMVVEASGYLDGNDLGGNLTGFVTESYRECMSACCANYPRCNNYAYNTFTRQCYLKGNYGSFRNSTDGSTMYGIIPAPQVIQGVTNASGSGYQVDVRDNFRLDWWGDDLKADFFVADWAACQQECLNAAPTCASFAFRKSDRKCWTKRSATFGSNPPADTNWLVGVIQQPIYSEGTYAVTSSGTSSCAVTFKLGLNYYGNDITGWSGVFLPKAGDCAKACCDNVPLCGSWSYDGRTRKCWLKSRYGDNPSNTTDYISGIIPPPPVVVGQVTAAPSRARNGTTPPDGLGTVVADGAFGFEIIDGFQIGWSWEISGYNWYFSATWRTCMADCAGLGPMCGSFRYDKPQRRCVLRRSIWGFANDPTRADVNQMYGVMNQPAIRTGIQNVTASKAVFNQTPPDGLPIIDPPPPLLTTSTTATATRTQTATSTPRTVTKTSTTIVAKLDVLPVRTSTRTPSRTSTRTSSKTSSRTASRTKTKTRTSTAAALRLQLVADKVATTTVRKSSTSTRKSTTKALALLAGKLTTKKALRRLLERQTSAPKVCQSNTTDNMDPQVWGWDISKYSGYWSASADTCAADCCALRNRCTLWIYRKSDRQCWLKTYAEVASPKNNTDYAYGLMVLPPVKTGAQNITASLATYPGRPSQGFDGTIGSKTAVVTIFDNKDPWQWGGEITNYTSYDSYLTCAEDCVALAPLCGMFVYSKRDRNCLLRTLTAASSDGPKDNTNLVYGVVAQPPVAEGTQVIQGSNAQAGGPAPNGISFVPGPASGTVSIVDNTNIWYWSWYGDLRGYSSYFSRDWRTCAADCVALSPICGSFAYQKSRRTCWLKTSAAAGTPPKVDLDMVYGLMQQPTAVSGFAPVTATNSTSQCTINIMPGKGIWGRDVAGFAGYFSPTYQTCAADCCSMPYVCQSFSYNKEQRACWLKTESGSNSYDDRTLIAGFMPFFTKAPIDAKLYAGFRNSSWNTITPNGTLQARQLSNNTMRFTTGPQVEISDDRNAIITWNGPSDTSQFVVTWGEVAGPNSTTFAATPNYMPTPLRILQIQPLEPGKWYMAFVQSVNQYGNLSLPTQPVYFQHDSSRVDALREQMTGFFDDFNIPAGPLDERNWRTLFVYCDDPAASATFINNQFHAHNLVASYYPPNGLTQRICDNTRPHVIARPNAIFDFTDREGTVVFDFDGGPGINYWFLDFVEPGTGDRFATLHQAGGMLKYFYGTNRTNSGEINAEFCNFGICLIPNVRRRFVVKISKTTINVTVDGQLMLHNQIGPGRVWCPDCITPIRKERAFLFFRQTTRGTQTEQNLPHLTVHWDNFGFDGPASLVITNTYKVVNPGSSKYVPVGLGWANNNNMTFNIPDSLDWAISARLHYGYSGSYISDDLTREYLIINGNRVKLFDANSIMDGQGVITAVNLSFIQQGINTIRWRMPRHETRIGNLRLEIDFPKNLAPTYTQPSTWFNLNRTNGFHPVMKKTGLQAVINSVGPYGTGPQGDGGPPFLFAPDDSPQGANLEYNQTYRITYSIRCGIQLISFGRCWGAQNVSLMLRNLSDPTRAITLQQYVFPPVPGTTSTHGVTNWGSSFEFRTADYQWGLSYELYVVAYDSNGTPALPDYFDGNHTTGEHFPAYLYIVEPDNDDTSNLTGLVRTIMKRDLQVGILEVENVSDRAPVPVDWHDMAAKLLGGEQESDHLNELFGAEDKEYASRELPSERAAPIKNETVVASSSGPRAPLPPKQIVPPPSDRPQSSTRSAFIVDVDESRSDPASLVGTVDPEAQHNPEFGLLTNTTDGYVANLLGSTPAGTMMVLPIPLDPSNTESPFDWGPGKDVEPSVGMENLGVGEIKG